MRNVLGDRTHLWKYRRRTFIIERVGSGTLQERDIWKDMEPASIGTYGKIWSLHLLGHMERYGACTYWDIWEDMEPASIGTYGKIWSLHLLGHTGRYGACTYSGFEENKNI